MTDHQTTRDGAATALILGCFAAGWFAWAQAKPPSSWLPWLTAGMLASILAAIAGGVLMWRSRSGPSVMQDQSANQRYGIIVGIESALAAAGAIALGRSGHAAFIAPWMCLVVGIHFWALAPVLQDPALKALCVLFVAVALAGWFAGWRGDVAASAVTGLGAGLGLLVFAARGVFIALHRPTPDAGHAARHHDVIGE